MATKSKVLVTGDVAIDHLYHTIHHQDQDNNWQLYPTLQTTLKPGGAFVLTEFVKEAAQIYGIEAEVTGQKVPDLYSEDARNMIQAKVLLSTYEDKDKNKWNRVEKYYGYSAPTDNKQIIPKVEIISSSLNLLILDDAGNGFRDKENEFPLAIDDEETLVIYKMSRPLGAGKLWDRINKRIGNWVLILQAKDLRQCNQVHVSKALSWERTAMEMVYQLKRNTIINELHKAPYLVIVFGTDGALLVPQNSDEKPVIIFDPENLEGDFASKIEGMALSSGAAFTAAFGVSMLKKGYSGIIEGIKEGLSSMRHLLVNGFIEENKSLFYPFTKIFGGKAYHYSDCLVKTSFDLDNPDRDFWRIMDDKTKFSNLLITSDIVKKDTPEILKEIPIGKYGKLQTFDRSEIEQYNSIKNLICEFLDDPKTNKPLCLAVFGPPGSGKSFGIKQLLDSFGRKDLPTMTFNISQYASYTDLIADFHKIRDEVLFGNIPVAFFDEFDSKKEDQALGWLKYFLSPMQDGKFKEGEAIHPIGKSIFVFAGGTRSTFHDFEQNMESDSCSLTIISGSEDTKDLCKRIENFKDAKGPDFVSRLRGFINILGLNPNPHDGISDSSFMIRRAKILRANFENTGKTKHLINSKGELHIDESVLRAMLNIPEYKHGNRSMSAILDMSRLTDKPKFDLSALPIREQLEMHVDAEVFLWLASNQRFFSLLPVEERFNLKNDFPDKDDKKQPKSQIIRWEDDLIEHIAYRIHDNYYQNQASKENKTEAFDEWVNLDEGLKKSNKDAAADIPVKLAMIGYGIRMKNEDGLAPIEEFDENKIQILEKEEHERWCREKRLQGWRWGIDRDKIIKTHPDLIPWEELDANTQLKDTEAIEAIPAILQEFGFYLYEIEDDQKKSEMKL